MGTSLQQSSAHPLYIHFTTNHTHPAMHCAPTDDDKSRLNLHHTPLIVKRAKHITRFNDIDGIYHVMPIPQFIAPLPMVINRV